MVVHKNPNYVLVTYINKSSLTLLMIVNMILIIINNLNQNTLF